MPPPGIEDEYLIAALRQSHRRFRLRHGTIVQLLQREGKAALLEKLASHWDHWLRHFEVQGSQRIEQVLDGELRQDMQWPIRCSMLTRSYTPLQPYHVARS